MLTLQSTELKCDQLQRVPGTPPLKWAGGKRWLVRRLSEMLAETPERIAEPFCGGAAIFFGLHPRNALLNDLNADLMHFYRVLRDEPVSLIETLKTFTNSEDQFYQVRKWKPDCPVEMAARFYYICRHSFNGLYRVNLKGEFNVPYNQKTYRAAFDVEELFKASQMLQSTVLLTGDFELAIDQTVANDVLYCDPPYIVAHNSNGFVKYNECLFTFEDQVRLARVAHAAASRGVRVYVSNADHPSIRDLYKGSRINSLERASVMGAQSEHRRSITELLIEVLP